MQSEIAAEKCHPALSLVKWYGQEKHGSLPPTHTKGLLLFIFLHPQAGQRLRPLHIKLIKGWLLSEMSLSARQQRKQTRDSYPSCWNSCAASHISLTVPCHPVPLSLPLRRWMHQLRCLSWAVPHVVCFWGVLDTFLFEEGTPVAQDDLELTK